MERFGATAREEAEGESLDERLSEEEPDPALAYDDDEGAPGRGAGSEGDDLDLDSSIDDQLLGTEFEGEVGDQRAGRLVSPDEGAHAEEAGVDIVE